MLKCSSFLVKFCVIAAVINCNIETSQVELENSRWLFQVVFINIMILKRIEILQRTEVINNWLLRTVGIRKCCFPRVWQEGQANNDKSCSQ